MDNEWTPERIRKLIRRVGSGTRLAQLVGTNRHTVLNWKRGILPHPVNEKRLNDLERQFNEELFDVTLSGNDLTIVIRALLDGRYLAKVTGISHENMDRSLFLIIDQACHGRKG